MITLTVAMPVYNSKHIVWLAMESLCRQVNIDFEWELIVCEEQNEEAAGEDFFRSYWPRLESNKCVLLKYIPLQQWVPLAQKWRIMGRAAESTSKVFVLKAADDWTNSSRLAISHRVLADGNYDWYQCDKGHFYHLFTGKLILYNHASHGFGGRMRSALSKATLTRHARNLPLSDKRKGVDNWFLSTIKNPRIYWDQSKVWKHDLYTQGMNNISKRRGTFFDYIRQPFFKATIPLKDIVPEDILERLSGKKEKEPDVPPPVVLPEYTPPDPGGPVSIVWVWVKGPAVWNEIAWSVKSVRKFFQGDYKLFVVGDNPFINGVNHIPAQLINGFAYCRSADIANKLSIIINSPDITDNFIFMYDDIMFLKPVNLQTFMRTVAHDHVPDYTRYFKSGKPGVPSPRWQVLFKQTFFMLEKKNLPTYNYETHLPRLLNKSRLKAIMDQYDLKEHPYLFNSIYFNTFHEKPDILLKESPHIKSGVYRPYDNEALLKKEIDGRMFLNFDDRGLNELLKREIQKRLTL